VHGQQVYKIRHFAIDALQRHERQRAMIATGRLDDNKDFTTPYYA